MIITANQNSNAMKTFTKNREVQVILKLDLS